MLTENGKKQEFSFAFLHSLVTDAGYSLERTIIDMDSVDATICSRGKINNSNGIILSPKIDVQLKATSRDDLRQEIIFDLTRKNYDDLRQDTLVPRILIAIFLSNEIDCLSIDEDKITLYGSAYWKSLKGMPYKDNSHTIRISFDSMNLITKKTLNELMIAASNREELAHVFC